MPDLIGWVSYASFFLVFASSFAIVVLGLNLQWGFTGLFNVGVAGFVALGAYTSALLTTPEVAGRLGGLGLPVAVGWIGAMGVSGLAGLVNPTRGQQCHGIDRRPLRCAVHPQAAAILARHRLAIDPRLPGTRAGPSGHRLPGA